MHRYKVIAAAAIVASLAGCSAAASHATVSAGDREACQTIGSIFQLAVAADGNVALEEDTLPLGYLYRALAAAGLDATTQSLQMSLDAASESAWALDGTATPSDLAPLLRQCEAIITTTDSGESS